MTSKLVRTQKRKQTQKRNPTSSHYKTSREGFEPGKIKFEQKNKNDDITRKIQALTTVRGRVVTGEYDTPIPS